MLKGARTVFVEPLTGILILPPLMLKVLAAPVVLYFPAMLSTPPETFNVPAFEIRSSSFAFPIFNVPFAMVTFPLQVTLALALKAAVAVLRNNLPVVGMVAATLKQAALNEVGIDNLKVPLMIFKNPFAALKFEAVISTVLVAEAPIFTLMRLNLVNVPVPLTV